MRADARFFGLVALVLAAAFLRLVPHPAGFAPIAALALFGSAHFSLVAGLRSYFRCLRCS
ncbi:MAG TPA: DUF6580 family putative transport protein [Bdellovibrionales bacterium]|nr:DUF6580 family putative transport protein [Bdellovibrionales bacterium]